MNLKVSKITSALPPEEKRKICEWVALKYDGWEKVKDNCYYAGIIEDGCKMYHPTCSIPDYFTIDAALALVEKMGLLWDISIIFERFGGSKHFNLYGINGCKEVFENSPDLGSAILRCLLRSQNVTEVQI